jgi:Nucleoside 2-deoxyribosyltransferase like
VSAERAGDAERADRRLVFLGGSCGDSDWRRRVAIPAHDAAGVSWFDPQVAPGAWTARHEAEDERRKDDADVLVFVIEGGTRAIASCGEAAYLIGAGRRVAVAVADVPDGATIAGARIGAVERADLNRGRSLVRAMAARHGVPVFADAAGAVEHAIALVRRARAPLTLDGVRRILDEVRFRDHAFVVDAMDRGFGLAIHYVDADVETGTPAEQRGRRWYIPPEASASDVVRTAFKAVVTSQEHIARELFTYRGARVFGPHCDVERLVELCERERERGGK